MLLECDLAATLMVAERLRQEIADNLIQTKTVEVAITVSIGVAEWHPSIKGLEELIHQADIALYTAKSSGRNKVCSNVP